MLLSKKNQDLMPSLFNELLDWNNWNYTPWATERFNAPKMNVSESDEGYHLELCVPGLKKEDLNLSIDADNNLVIEMVQQEEKKENDNDRHYLRREFSKTQFKQLLALPDNVKSEQISAKVAEGILYIELPKVTEQEKKSLTKSIAIS